jgi:hypothetical protein
MATKNYESTRCDRCGQRIRQPAEDLPIATRTWVSWQGRMLYSIAGKPGLFLMKRDKDSGIAIMATRGPGKSTGGMSLFIPATEVEARLILAMGLSIEQPKAEENDGPDNSD